MRVHEFEKPWDPWSAGDGGAGDHAVNIGSKFSLRCCPLVRGGALLKGRGGEEGYKILARLLKSERDIWIGKIARWTVRQTAAPRLFFWGGELPGPWQELRFPKPRELASALTAALGFSSTPLIGFALQAVLQLPGDHLCIITL